MKPIVPFSIAVMLMTAVATPVSGAGMFDDLCRCTTSEEQLLNPQSNFPASVIADAKKTSLSYHADRGKEALAGWKLDSQSAEKNGQPVLVVYTVFTSLDGKVKISFTDRYNLDENHHITSKLLEGETLSDWDYLLMFRQKQQVNKKQALILEQQNLLEDFTQGTIKTDQFHQFNVSDDALLKAFLAENLEGFDAALCRLELKNPIPEISSLKYDFTYQIYFNGKATHYVAYIRLEDNKIWYMSNLNVFNKKTFRQTTNVSAS